MYYVFPIPGARMQARASQATRNAVPKRSRKSLTPTSGWNAGWVSELRRSATTRRLRLPLPLRSLRTAPRAAASLVTQQRVWRSKGVKRCKDSLMIAE
jgi:hypothetical protein